MRLITLLAVVVALLTVSVNAQDVPGSSTIKIDGKTLQASSYKEFQALLELTKSVNELKKQRAERRLTLDMYNNAVSVLFDKAVTQGIIIHN